jgi:hypothetical protein
MSLAVGRHWAYYIVSLTITVVLALAANTSFGGLPILASLLARDNYLPHIFGLRGDRQVFNSGIWVLAGLSAALLIAVDGNTIEMIPLYAIGVFTGFTLSQSGLVVRWWHQRPPRWHYRAAINGLGAIITGLATVIFLISKFVNGAWIVVIAVPGFVLLFERINAYYKRTGATLGLGKIPPAPEGKSTLVIVPVVNVSELTRFAIGEALSLSKNVIAVSVIVEAHDQGAVTSDDLEAEWAQWNPGPRLELLHTDYTSVIDPICSFIDEEQAKRDQQIVVLIPVLIPARWRYRVLHNQLDVILSRALRKRPEVLVAKVQLPLSESTVAHLRPSRKRS